MARPTCQTDPVRLRIDLAYDGTDFHGWAAQPRLRTVQGELSAALATVLPRAEAWTSSAPAAPMRACTPAGRWRTATSTPTVDVDRHGTTR